MTGLYLFCAGLGIPLLAWLLFAGDESGDDSASGDDGGVASAVLRVLPLTTIAMVLAVFGIAGFTLQLLGTGSAATLGAAAASAGVAGALNSTVFSYLRRSESTSSVRDDDLAGAVGRVVMPVAPGRRGRVAVTVSGQQLYLSATALPGAVADDELEVGAPVLVVDVRDGIARVSRLDPELT